jgi:hypothetical protein
VPPTQIEVDDDAHASRSLPAAQAMGVNCRWRRSRPRSI